VRLEKTDPDEAQVVFGDHSAVTVAERCTDDRDGDASDPDRTGDTSVNQFIHWLPIYPLAATSANRGRDTLSFGPADWRA
jgi:hypothetical protein